MTFRAITASLVLRTALHVGSGRGTETADDLLRRDVRGRLIIPGTAIAGGLRSTATRLAPRLAGGSVCLALEDVVSDKACQCRTCKIFGDINPQEDKEQASAALVTFYDAFLDPTPDLHIRDGVGIDRVTGAAARRERTKFDLEVLPAGAIFKLRIEIDRRIDDKHDPKVLQLLAAVLSEWQEERGVIGGGVSRGLGAFLLRDVQFINWDLNDPENLIEVLRHGPPWDKTDGDKHWVTNQVTVLRPEIEEWKGNEAMQVARSWASVQFTLAFTGPFLTHDLVQAGRGGFDHAPVLATYQKRALPILPGSSLRGVLRSQAERIARTIATAKAWDTGKDQGSRKLDFMKTCPACNPSAGTTERPAASCNSFIKRLNRKERRLLERQGAESKLCLACRLFGSTWNGSRLRVEDAPFVGERADYKVLDFLAIDRFTGGARDTAKFDALVLWKPKFSVRLFLENPEPWELGWLALALRDLNDGLTAIGFGRAKGFGDCRIENPSLTIGILHNTDFPLPRTQHGDDVLQKAIRAGSRVLGAKGADSGLYHTVAHCESNQDDWLLLANGWVGEFNIEVATHPRPTEFTLNADSYFTNQQGYWLPDLYPVRMS